MAEDVLWRDRDGNLNVAYLYWDDEHWYLNFNWLDNDNWNANDQLLRRRYFFSRCLSQPPVILPISTN